MLVGTQLFTPPAAALSAWFAGWHATRHLARVLDAGTRSGDLPADRSHALRSLLGRSGVTTSIGLLGAGTMAWRAARRGRSPARAAISAVLGLTVPHTAAVLTGLTPGTASRPG